jgi:hypothetical protein
MTPHDRARLNELLQEKVCELAEELPTASVVNANLATAN